VAAVNVEDSKTLLLLVLWWQSHKT